jgi:hypothetical protein
MLQRPMDRHLVRIEFPIDLLDQSFGICLLDPDLRCVVQPQRPISQR